jgi:hypothetical protein
MDSHILKSHRDVIAQSGDVSPERCNGKAHAIPAVDAPRLTTEEELETLACQSLALEKAAPEEIITWAVENYYPKLTMATAFGPEGCLILAMAVERHRKDGMRFAH